MADTSRKKPAAKPVAAPTPPAPVLYIRNVSPETIAALDSWVASRRAELGAAATDTASRRVAAAFSRNDLLVDIIEAAVKARAVERGETS